MWMDFWVFSTPLNTVWIFMHHPLIQKYWNVFGIFGSKPSINLTVLTNFCSGFIDPKLPYIYIHLHQFGPIKNPDGSELETPSPLWIYMVIWRTSLPLGHPHGLWMFP